jgi:tRNA-dihydrouridine synthase 3
VGQGFAQVRPAGDEGHPEVRVTPFPHDVILAPLTRGGNLPFRRLCADFGAKVTFSEMAYAHKLVQGSGREMALLRSHASEQHFGVQIATHKPELAAEAAAIAEAHGAKFVDLNCGCPIDDAVKRGMGARLLQRTAVLAETVKLMVGAVKVPVTVKIRTGFQQGKENYDLVGRLVEEAGAAAVTLHGRTREQRYSKAADWEKVGEMVASRGIPVYGNGDILTWYEAETRRATSHAAGIMLGRGPLTKPWIFQEIAERREMAFNAEERVQIYHRLAGYFKEHFGDDEIGHRRTMYFLPWHFSFLSRYVHLPEAVWAERAVGHPLLQTRDAAPNPGPDADVLEHALADGSGEVHQEIAQILWEAADAAEATSRIREAYAARLAAGHQRRTGRGDAQGWG